MQSPPTHRKKGDDERCDLTLALQCAADLQKRLVLFNPSTSVGVVLFNTVSTNPISEIITKISCFRKNALMAKKENIQ